MEQPGWLNEDRNLNGASCSIPLGSGKHIRSIFKHVLRQLHAEFFQVYFGQHGTAVFIAALKKGRLFKLLKKTEHAFNPYCNRLRISGINCLRDSFYNANSSNVGNTTQHCLRRHTCLLSIPRGEDDVFEKGFHNGHCNVFHRGFRSYLNGCRFFLRLEKCL